MCRIMLIQTNVQLESGFYILLYNLKNKKFIIINIINRIEWRNL